MRKILKALAFIIFCLVIYGAVSLYRFMDQENEIIILKDGTTKIVEETQKSGDFFFYVKDGDTHLISPDEIQSVGKLEYKHLILLSKNAIRDYTHRAIGKIKQLPFKEFIRSAKVFTDPKRFTFTATLAVLLFFFIILFSKARLKGKLKDAKKSSKPKSVPAVNPGLPNRIDIVRFFLNIYRLQIGAEPDAAAKIVPLSTDASGANHTYELRVQHLGDWSTRRMTIGPLGEESGSKSKCYSVIYDVHLVVKVPVQHIVDFDNYIESIKKEKNIVDKLAPKECIIPRVSVILSLFHRLKHTENLPPEKVEEKYINWVRKSEAYQEYLKIKNTFVYFMDLSKYYFLGDIIGNLHNIENSLASEITDNSGVIWDSDKFILKYGEDNEAVGFDIREVYDRCEAQIRGSLAKAGLSDSPPLYQIQAWFRSHLAEKEVISGGDAVPDKYMTGINHIFKTILKEHADAVEAYRQTVKQYLYSTSLEQNRLQMGSIITNLLELLAWLRKKRVAMRDLKPDNLLVAGDPAKFPLFLNSPSEYSLGIIDVETAVDFEGSKEREIDQPLLGGTPFYATPSHFIRNQDLLFAFNNLNKILHFQDWHAALVMIYKVVTGELLFEKTPKLFSNIKSMIQNAFLRNLSPDHLLEEISWLFWRSAVAEFQMKTREKEKVLKSIRALVAKDAKHMFIKVVAKQRKLLAANIQQQIFTQTLFDTPQIREFLTEASFDKMGQFIKKFENNGNLIKNPNVDKTQALKFLRGLANVKLQEQQQSLMAKRLAQPEPTLTAYDLMGFMFKTVLHAMHKKEWRSLLQPKVQTARQETDDRTAAATH